MTLYPDADVTALVPSKCSCGPDVGRCVTEMKKNAFSPMLWWSGFDLNLLSKCLREKREGRVEIRKVAYL